MKIKLSKKQWQFIGKQAGWMKTAQSVDLEQLYEQHNMARVQKPVFVTVYEISRNYGGPEEGGWWYDQKIPQSSKKFFDIEEAEAFADKLNGELDASGANDEPISSSRGIDQYPDPSRGDPAYDHSDSDIPSGFGGLATNQRAIVEDFVGANTVDSPPHWE